MAAQKRGVSGWAAWLLLLALAAMQSYVSAREPGERDPGVPTLEESLEAERVAREHFGDQVVDGAKALTQGDDADPAGRSERGMAVTAAVSQLTGTTINPLFGMTAIGAWNYFTTPKELRDGLPFYDQPFIWGSLLAVMLLMFFNSTICESMPFLKIPLNALGDLVNKGGAAVVLPIALNEFARAFARPAADALVAASDWVFPVAHAAGGGAAAVGTAAAEGWWLYLGWAAALFGGAFVYAVVWVVWNVVDVTILLVPVPGLDAILKSVRLGAVALVFGAAALNPWLGLAVSLSMILICWFLAGWAFRIMVMGFVFATDLLFFWRAAAPGDAGFGVKAFISAKGGRRWKVPARSYGRIRRGTGDALIFAWRPWLIGWRREVVLGRPSDFWGGSTLLYPVVLGAPGDSRLFRLPPRYRRCWQETVRTFGLRGWRDVSMVRGLWRSLLNFFKSGEFSEA